MLVKCAKDKKQLVSVIVIVGKGYSHSYFKNPDGFKK